MTDSYPYVECAFGSISNRGRMIRYEELHLPEPARECYQSVNRFDDQAHEFVQERGTVKEMPPLPCWPPYIVFDIDNVQALDTALDDVRRLVKRLREDFGIDNPLIGVWFSGNSGFHVSIDSRAAGFEPNKQAHVIHKLLARTLAGNVPIDTKIYDRTRLFRIENSINAKSGLYKIPLTHEELATLTIDQIKELAKHPRTIDRPQLDDVPISAKLNEAYMKAVEQVCKTEEKYKAKPNTTSGCWRELTRVAAITSVFVSAAISGNKGRTKRAS